MNVSIIICTRDRASSLHSTLQSLKRVYIPSSLDAELLIIDNGSTDHTKETVSTYEYDAPKTIRYVCETNPGLAHARNRALIEAKGDILLFTDDDVRFPEDWIVGMTKPIRTGSADAVAGGVRLAPNLQRPWMNDWHRSFLASSDRINSRPVTDMIGANMGFSRHVLEKVPRFDPHLGAGRLGFSEESHFAERLHLAGFKIALATDIEVEHHPDPDRLKRISWKQAAENLGRSQAYIHYHWRHEEKGFSGGYLVPFFKIANLYMRLMYKRITNMSDVLRHEGMASWENYYLREISYLKKGIEVRKNPRNYEKYGLTMKSDN